MYKIYFLGLLIVTFFFIPAIFYPVRSGYNQSTTEKKAVEKGWAKFTTQAGDTNPNGPPCAIRPPNEAEISSLISYCKTQPIKIDYNPVPDQCDSFVRNLAQRSCDNVNKPKLFLKPTNTPTVTPTNTPTPIFTPTPTPKLEPFSILGNLNNNSLLREIIISTLISISTVIIYHFVSKKG